MTAAPMGVAVSPAEPAQLDLVLAILDEAAGWLASRGVEQWPARFRPEWVVEQVAAGYTWLAWVDGAAVGTVTLDWDDPLWTDGIGAGYVHRLAVRRGAAGLGRALLDWAGRATRQHGHDRLRLDCVARNRRLCRYYEAAGFAARGTALVGGAPGQRIAGGDRTLVARFEKVLDQRPLR